MCHISWHKSLVNTDARDTKVPTRFDATHGYSLAFMADVFAQALRLQFGVALVTEGAAAALYEAQIGQLDVTLLASEAARVPVLVHRLDHPADDEFAALAATGREQHLEIVLAVLAPLELEERAVLEDLKALRTPRNINTRFNSNQYTYIIKVL